MMQKLSIKRQSSENKYLHRDFHNALDQGLVYLGVTYGGGAVEEYLRRFAENCYAALIKDVKARGLLALREHISRVYEAEEAGGAVSFKQTERELAVTVSACPAVAYMRSIGYTPSKWYVKTTSTVYKAVAGRSGVCFEMLSYEEETGAARYRFYILKEREGSC